MALPVLLPTAALQETFAGVNMETIWASLATGFFGGANINLNRFTGPGRVGVQSMHVRMPQAK